ncbi:hypothetical protein SSS_03354 [Sarcoptes scabiei]|uniref:Uncharacterized protein n=1 Tax=Sarcoptes scabiei TaxID=52283 RepID=A0A834RFT7_SARSC|nr:hypothetical protein SSS_03354 [Sarcoptes scabiei]
MNFSRKNPPLLKTSFQKYSNLSIRLNDLAKLQLILSKERFYETNVDVNEDSLFDTVEYIVGFLSNKMVRMRDEIVAKLEEKISISRWRYLKYVLELWIEANRPIFPKQLQSYEEYKKLIATEGFPKSLDAIREYYFSVYDATIDLINALDKLKNSDQWQYAIERESCEESLESDSTVWTGSDPESSINSDDLEFLEPKSHY